jgi:DNA-binding MarR family transcriptional regulator
LSRQVLPDQVSAQTVFARLLHAHGSLMRSVEARLRAEHGLSANDFETLLHLSNAEAGSLRRIDLAERLRLTPSGVTRLLDGLEEAGLTGRRDCPSDARVTYSVATDAGRAKLRAAFRTHAAVCEELIGSHLSPSELDELSDLLGRLPGGDEFEANACTGG